MELTPFFFGLYKLVKYGVYPLTWVVILAAATMLLTWLPPSSARQRWARFMATSTCLLLLMITSPLIARPLVSLLESWPAPHSFPPNTPIQAIVILGGGLHDKGTLRPSIELSEESRLRTLCGADLYRQGLAGKVVITGGNASVFGSGPTEAATMKEWAMRLGVPPEAILTDSRARTTYENAIGTRHILGDSASILLVTSASHIVRAAGLFEKQGFLVTSYACGYRAKDRVGDGWDHLTAFDFLPSSWAMQRTSDVIEEVAGILVYRLAGKL